MTSSYDVTHGLSSVKYPDLTELFRDLGLRAYFDEEDRRVRFVGGKYGQHSVLGVAILDHDPAVDAIDDRVRAHADGYIARQSL
jgi:hypothetical protein